MPELQLEEGPLQDFHELATQIQPGTESGEIDYVFTAYLLVRGYCHPCSETGVLVCVPPLNVAQGGRQETLSLFVYLPDKTWFK